MTKKEYGDCEALFILKEQLDTNLTCCARETLINSFISL